MVYASCPVYTRAAGRYHTQLSPGIREARDVSIVKRLTDGLELTKCSLQNNFIRLINGFDHQLLHKTENRSAKYRLHVLLCNIQGSSILSIV